MSMTSVVAVGALVLALGGPAVQAQTTPGTPPSPNMPAPAGFENNQTDDTVGTSGQDDRTSDNRSDANRQDLPDTASPLPLIALGGLAALGGAAALRRLRQ